ncbi:hypothetical protein IEQ34_022074 [Dendrobium chrysotoxum]|uniref:Transcriptional regulator n=1 Tax=Dendrobium chrysotoxum TaxID=161865 RepID=A0AAV7FK06_DENCH|nr:hypothetical protein IEQ34_022074 [Dendrobium chrysotoxum]
MDWGVQIYAFSSLVRQIYIEYTAKISNGIDTSRHLGLTKAYILSICEIGKLNSLQGLFFLRDVSKYRIGELKNMNDLHKLEI